jgi:TetR/AcrR family transcriptional repressor of nem operon
MPRGRPASSAALLDAAADLFTEHGYHQTTVSAIAHHAGLTTGAIYSRPGGKTQLLADALTRNLDARLDHVQHYRPQAPLRVVLAEATHELASQPQRGASPLLLDAIAAARHDEQLAALVRTQLRRAVDSLQERFDTAANRGELAAQADPRALAELGQALAVGAAALASVGLTPTPERWAPIIELLSAALTETRPT